MTDQRGELSGSRRARARFPARSESLLTAREWVAGYSRRTGVPRPLALKLELLVEELMTNTLRHGFADPASDIEITLEPQSSGGTAPSRVALGYADRGAAFDPRTAPASPRSGGFGLRLIRGFSVGLVYERRKDVNHLRLEVPLSR